LVVDRLEERYGGFDGLNLTFETREGILKHCSRNNAATLGDLGRRFLEGQQPSLEAQLANLADEVAYNNHDIDDGLRSGLITLEQLEGVPLWAIHRREAEAAFPNVSGRRLINETIRRIINALIVDLIGTTRAGIADVAPRCIDDVRAAPALVAFSDPMREEARALKRFLFDNLYRHYLVMRMAAKARRIIDDLFRVFMDDPRLLPPQYQAKATPEEQPRWIAHYIAGMTDRYAIKEHRRIFAVDAV
jgi:dGTPase